MRSSPYRPMAALGPRGGRSGGGGGAGVAAVVITEANRRRRPMRIPTAHLWTAGSGGPSLWTSARLPPFGPDPEQVEPCLM